jgi:voltage-dependent potassium channel beta subunit
VEYRNLGKSGLKISAIGLGTWMTYGGRLDEPTETSLVRRAFDLGINFFDTADVYKRGEAELALGKSLMPFARKDYVLASKVYFPIGDGPNDRGLSRKHIFESIDASLERLGTHYLDLYQAHRFDEETPLEEIVRAFGDLVAMGKIHYWGVSMWEARHIREACRLCRELNLPLPVSNQPVYNLLDRHIEKEVVPVCSTMGLGILPFSPLAQGVLTGKYLDGSKPADSRAADEQHNQFMGRYLEPEAMEKVGRMRELASVAEVELTHLSLAWCLSNDSVSSVIVGATKVPQLEQNAAALDMKIPEGTLGHLEEIFPL